MYWHYNLEQDHYYAFSSDCQITKASQFCGHVTRFYFYFNFISIFISICSDKSDTFYVDLG